MPYAALRELAELAGFAPIDAAAVEISGTDPVFQTRYRVGAAGAAALAATGLGASELWALRTGRRQRVAVDLRAAAASLRSAYYLKLDGKPPPPFWDPVSGFYPTADGRWVQLHCNFTNHRERALGVLGAPPDRHALEQASLRWGGEALEEAIIAAGGCAGLVRSAESWACHPQAAALASLPLLEIRRIGDSMPEPLPPADRPLAGIRVLDLTRVLAGPTCARTLAEHGADVLKITAAHLPDSGAVEFDTGLGKLSARLDLRERGDHEILRRLVRDSDIFSQSYRPGALAARGFAPNDLAELRPGIVCASLSAWGHVGPWRERRGFDTIVQSVNGMAEASGDGRKPRHLPVSAIDYVSGYLLAFGTMVALGRRAREGGSWLVRVSLARTARWILERGEVDAAALKGLPADLPAEEIDRLTEETAGPAGLVRHLKPVVRLSETPARWARPCVPLGFHAPVWPPFP